MSQKTVLDAAPAARHGALAWSWLTALAITAVYGCALWFRAIDLGTIPGINGDEAWYGVQAERALMHGSFALLTPSGLPLNPLLIGIDYAMLAMPVEPSFWMLRVPSLLAGVLTVALAYVLIARTFDRAAALTTSLLLAALPIAIAYSRFGWDASETPLVTLIALCLAVRRQYAACALAFAVALLVHPTNVFLLPIILAPMVVAWFGTIEDPRARERLAATLIGGAFGALAVLFLLRWRLPYSVHWERLLDSDDWWRYVFSYGRLLSGATAYEYLAGPIGQSSERLLDALFWFVFTGVVGLGTLIMARRREWTRLSLAAGLLIALLLFFLIGGPDAIQPRKERYSIFLVVPSVLVFSLALTSIGGAGAAARRMSMSQAGVVLGLCAAMLAQFQVHYFDLIRATGGEVHLTFRTAAMEPKAAALKVVLADAREADPQHRTPAVRVLAAGWWLYWPMQYLAGKNPHVEVMDLKVGKADAEAKATIRLELENGTYLVTFANDTADVAAQDMANMPVARTDIADAAGRRLISIYHRPAHTQPLPG